MRFLTALLTASLLIGSLLSSTAAAAIRPYSFYFHPQGGWYAFESDEPQEDAPHYGLGLGYRFSRSWSSEIIGNFINSDATDAEGGTVDTYLLRWEALYNFRPHARLVPYLAAGVGGLLVNESGGATYVDGVIQYGAGLQAFFSKAMAVRIDGRHLVTLDRLTGEEFNNLLASAGIVVQMGGEEEKPALVDTDGDGVIDAFDRCPDTRLGIPVDGFGCPVDRDRDGIPDFRDQCPDTPAGVAVDGKGCSEPAPADSDRDGVEDARDACPETPAGAPVDNSGCPRDSDRDGIPDFLDKCPSTPAGAVVDTSGCSPSPGPSDQDGDGVLDPADTCPGTPAGVTVDQAGCPPDADRDGVPDASDTCPGTPAGSPVDSAGCPPAQKKVSLTLHPEFPPGQATLRPENQGVLQKAVVFLRANPGRDIVVEGHTDSIGSEAANLRLSLQRAEIVRRFLVENAGIDPNRITAEGYGESRPVASNATPEGRIENRRVVIRVRE